MHKKQLYMAPEAEPLVVQIEGVICESGGEELNFGNPGMPGNVLEDGGIFIL